MTTAERIDRILSEIDGVASLFGVTSWEREFLASVKAQSYPITDRQAKTLLSIEKKVFEEHGDE